MSKCLFFRGDFFIRNSPHECPPRPDNCSPRLGAFRKIGNTSSFQVSIDSVVIGKENTFNRVKATNRTAIRAVSLSMTIETASRENLLFAFDAIQDEITKESIDERFCFDASQEYIILSYAPINDSLLLLGKDSFGNIVQVFSEGFDFKRNGSLIDLDIVDPDVKTITASYDFNNTNIFSFKLKDNNKRYKEIFFKGFNIVDNSPVELKFYRTLFNNISSFEIMSNGQFFNLPLNAVVEESNQGYFEMSIIGEKDESGIVIY